LVDEHGRYVDGHFAGGPIAGPFRPNWESLKAYRVPDWFRDAKLGIWSHWSPQCVPEQGDWYAHGMYVQGSPQYDFHVRTYGHPSKFGYKDLCRLWRAERWDPDGLMERYARAGARYFVALANHHGNFDCWDSKYQPWNSVNVGPRRDIVGTWEKTARAHGLRFGITYHGTPGRVWREFMPVRYGSDERGPLKGVPYDGLLTETDGKGTWWEGLDPRGLNGPPHAKSDPCPAFVEDFMLRVQDVIDKYEPDLLYFDDNCDWDFDAGAPFGQPLNVWLGMPELTPHIMAYHYNRNWQRNGGSLDAVFNIKIVPEAVLGTLVRDFEMTQAGRIEPDPWQTDVCIGSWHYDRSLLESHGYRTAKSMVHLLADVVSKNGNLLLNVPLPGHGMPDDDELRLLDELSAWMAVNGEAIYSTRPWRTFGEGPTDTTSVSLYKEALPEFVGGDLRFTTREDALYAIALAWPEDGTLVIRSLCANSPDYPGAIASVGLLGSNSHLEWSRGETGLVVRLPDERPCDHAFVLRIDPERA
jgi:alpha-L-fucosidase